MRMTEALQFESRHLWFFGQVCLFTICLIVKYVVHKIHYHWLALVCRHTSQVGVLRYIPSKISWFDPGYGSRFLWKPSVDHNIWIQFIFCIREIFTLTYLNLNHALYLVCFTILFGYFYFKNRSSYKTNFQLLYFSLLLFIISFSLLILCSHNWLFIW